MRRRSRLGLAGRVHVAAPTRRPTDDKRPKGGNFRSLRTQQRAYGRLVGTSRFQWQATVLTRLESSRPNWLVFHP